MEFDSLTDERKDKLKSCKTPEQVIALANLSLGVLPEKLLAKGYGPGQIVPTDVARNL